MESRRENKDRGRENKKRRKEKRKGEKKKMKKGPTRLLGEKKIWGKDLKKRGGGRKT